MAKKKDSLAARNLISTKLSAGLDICASIRNKVGHGNILDEDDEFVGPLFPIVLNQLQQFITELDKGLFQEHEAF